MAVDAFVKLLGFRGVTFRTFSGLELSGSGNFVDVAVTGRTWRFAQSCVDAFRRVCHLLAVACIAFDLRNFRGMRKLLDRCMTILAAEDAMHAGRVLAGIDRNVIASLGFHPSLAVAGEAGLILFERLSFFCLLSRNLRRAKNTDKRYQQSGGKCDACVQICVLRVHRKLSVTGTRTAWRRESRVRFRTLPPAPSRRRPGSPG